MFTIREIIENSLVKIAKNKKGDIGKISIEMFPKDAVQVEKGDKEPYFIVRLNDNPILSSSKKSNWTLEEIIDNFVKYNMIRGVIDATGLDINSFLKESCEDNLMPFVGSSVIFTERWLKETAEDIHVLDKETGKPTGQIIRYKKGCGILRRNHDTPEQVMKIIGLVKKKKD